MSRWAHKTQQRILGAAGGPNAAKESCASLGSVAEGDGKGGDDMATLPKHNLVCVRVCANDLNYVI